MKTVRLGIIGMGNIGLSHAGHFMRGEVPSAELVAVSNVSRARREEILAKLPKALKVFPGGEELIASGCCDAVIIAAPHYGHEALTCAALEAGLHVLCEKPAGVYTRQARNMNAAADRHAHLTFAMMFNQRTNPLYRAIYDFIAAGKLGELKRVNWIITNWYRPQVYYDCVAWRGTWASDGGGVLMNQSPHQLDLLQWFCGMPVRVRAFCHEGKFHAIEVEDDVTAYLEYENGATGVFITSTGDAPGTNRLEITGTKATLICEKNQLTVRELDTEERVLCAVATEAFMQPTYREYTIVPEGENEQCLGVIKAFIGNILQGTPLIADGREGLQSLMLANAMYLSSWTEKTLTLPIDEALFEARLNLRREGNV